MTAPTDARRFGALKTLVFSALPVLLLLTIAEVIVRISGAATSCPSVGLARLWVCDPILHFRWNPQILVRGQPVNAQGFRNAELREKAEGVFRIVALGDSCTFGFQQTDRAQFVPEPYPQRLERLITEQGVPGKIEVVNAGVPAYNSYHGVMLLRTTLRHVEADLVTVRYGWNDLMSSPKVPAGTFHEPTTLLGIAVEDLLLLSALYPFGLRLGMELRASLQKSAASLPALSHEWIPTVPIADYEHNLRRIADLAHRRGARVWFLTIPDAFTTKAFTGQYASYEKSAAKQLEQFKWSRIRSFRESHEIRASYNDALRRVAAEVGVPVIDMEAAYSRPAQRPLFGPTDVIHPNSDGHEIEARALYRQLEAEGIVRGPPE